MLLLNIHTMTMTSVALFFSSRMSLRCSALYLAQFRHTCPHLLANGGVANGATIVGNVYIHPSAKVHPTAKVLPSLFLTFFSYREFKFMKRLAETEGIWKKTYFRVVLFGLENYVNHFIFLCTRCIYVPCFFNYFGKSRLFSALSLKDSIFFRVDHPLASLFCLPSENSLSLAKSTVSNTSPIQQSFRTVLHVICADSKIAIRADWSQCLYFSKCSCRSRRETSWLYYFGWCGITSKWSDMLSENEHLKD